MKHWSSVMSSINCLSLRRHGVPAGAAAALLADAEARLSAAGVELAWLACAIGNERAARFYGPRGWRRAGTVVSLLETSVGTIPLEVWRYEKRLQAPPVGPALL